MKSKLCRIVLLSILATTACAITKETRVAAKPDKILDFVKCVEATGQHYKWYADVSGALIVASEVGDFEPIGKDEQLVLCILKYSKDVPIAIQHITNAEGAGKWEEFKSEHAAKMVDDGVTGLEHVEANSTRSAAANDKEPDINVNQLTGNNLCLYHATFISQTP